MRVEDAWEAAPGDGPREATRLLAMAAASGKVAQLLRSREMRVLPATPKYRLLAPANPFIRMVTALKAAVRRNC